MTGQSDNSANTSETKPPVRTRRKDRAFKRSRAARQRRAAQDKKDFRLVVILLQVSVLGALVLAAIGVAGLRIVNNPDATGQGLVFMLAEPVFMGLSVVEISAGVIFIVVTGALLWRSRKTR